MYGDGIRWCRTSCLLPFLASGVLVGAFWLISDHMVDSPDPRAAESSPQPAHTVTGTLALLDTSTGKGMLKTDLDKPIFFEVTRADHFKGLSIGDRVTIQLDEEGRALKVIEALPAELHEPPPAPAQ